MPEDAGVADPYFDCDGYVNDCRSSPTRVPFFGQELPEDRSGVQGSGHRRCKTGHCWTFDSRAPMTFPTLANAFKGTDRCDQQTTQCEFVPGRRFGRGGYKCICKQGYEYPFYDPTTFYDGDVMEVEYEKTVKGLPNRFEQLTCRIGGAGAAHASVVATALLLLVATWGR
ncbi:PREDICTED: uncharacterized protein LOC106816523 [Priapulus caudatus]|uniref:Uncharacterized protein LOC106816523 n=1 Tax=Priapulus caudatus TaxID=37621 RepID=A0ABM1EWR6_PRICU|nr:PREDICTED: uncharacterized protein LOC106816523 [Priapulus caudatus]